MCEIRYKVLLCTYTAFLYSTICGVLMSISGANINFSHELALLFSAILYCMLSCTTRIAKSVQCHMAHRVFISVTSLWCAIILIQLTVIKNSIN